MRRYHTATGSDPEIKAAYHMMGPQAADQLPAEVVQLLERLPKVTSVAVMYDYGNGPRIDLYQRLQDET